MQRRVERRPEMETLRLRCGRGRGTWVAKYAAAGTLATRLALALAGLSLWHVCPRVHSLAFLHWEYLSIYRMVLY